MNNLSTVLETYAGKPKEFEECERLIRKIIDKIEDDHKNPLALTRDRSVYRSVPECAKLESILTKFFKVNSIKIYWQMSSFGPHTIATSSISRMNRKSKGDVSSLNIFVVVTENVVYHCGLNEREIMAAILHEIGHNFYVSPLSLINEILGVVLSPISILVRLIGRPLHQGYREFVDGFLKKKLPIVYNIAEGINNLSTQINSIFKTSSILKNLLTLFGNIKKGGIQSLVSPIRLIMSIDGYGNERGADSFAVKYGYGPDLITGLDKLTKQPETIGGGLRDNLGTLGEIAQDIQELSLDLMVQLLQDPHPNHNQRSINALKKLERDFENGDYPPELRNELKSEINRMRKIYETMHDNEGNVEIKKAWYQTIDKITNGHSDLREIFNIFYTKYEF